MRRTFLSMRLETLFLVCFAGVIQGKKRLWNSAENEVLDKSDVMMRFPSFLYEVPKETLKKNVVQRRIRGRIVPTSVEPMQGVLVFKRNIRIKMSFF